MIDEAVGNLIRKFNFYTHQEYCYPNIKTTLGALPLMFDI